MTYSVRDWLNVLIILILSPFILGTLYLAVGSSVIGVDHGLAYIYILLIVFAWILINTIIGYRINKDSMTISYPNRLNVFRGSVDLTGTTCYDLVGFDEIGVANESIGFRKFKIILNGDFGKASLIFNRESVAREFYNQIKDSLPKRIQEGSCIID